MLCVYPGAAWRCRVLPQLRNGAIGSASRSAHAFLGLRRFSTDPSTDLAGKDPFDCLTSKAIESNSQTIF
jgi:hypothetical protein